MVMHEVKKGTGRDAPTQTARRVRPDSAPVGSRATRRICAKDSPDWWRRHHVFSKEAAAPAGPPAPQPFAAESRQHIKHMEGINRTLAPVGSAGGC